MKNAAKKALLTITIASITSTAIADDATTDYKAKLTDDGKFCAKVKIRDFTGNRTTMKCRTLAQWKAKGYTVKIPQATDSPEKTPHQNT